MFSYLILSLDCLEDFSSACISDDFCITNHSKLADSGPTNMTSMRSTASEGQSGAECRWGGWLSLSGSPDVLWLGWSWRTRSPGDPLNWPWEGGFIQLLAGFWQEASPFPYGLLHKVYLSVLCMVPTSLRRGTRRQQAVTVMTVMANSGPSLSSLSHLRRMELWATSLRGEGHLNSILKFHLLYKFYLVIDILYLRKCQFCAFV